MEKNIVNRKSGIVVLTGVKAGGLGLQHNRKSVAGLRVKSRIKSGSIGLQHNRAVRLA